MQRSKFNVGSDIAKRTFNEITFDSEMEMKYYRDVVCPGVESGYITAFELQKKYELQPKFSRSGKTVNAITYVADFYIEYFDGKIEVIDVKGYPDSVAKIKRKMFWFVYPELEYKWMSYVQKFGGWIEYEELKALRKDAKKEKEKLEVLRNGKK